MSVDADNPFARRPAWKQHVRALTFAVLLSLAAVLTLRGVVARGDVLKALLVEHNAGLAFAVMLLFAARAFLLFMAPGWALYAGLRFVQARREQARETASPTV